MFRLISCIWIIQRPLRKCVTKNVCTNSTSIEFLAHDQFLKFLFKQCTLLTWSYLEWFPRPAAYVDSLHWTHYSSSMKYCHALPGYYACYVVIVQEG